VRVGADAIEGLFFELNSTVGKRFNDARDDVLALLDPQAFF
jgi:hypothetical protein